MKDNFYTKFFLEDGNECKVSDFSISKEEKNGFVGYYITAKSDKKLNGKNAMELHSISSRHIVQKKL